MTNVNEFSIREAILDEGIVPYAQPIVALTDGDRMLGDDVPNLSFEFLGRVVVDGQVLTPREFMPVAEKDPVLLVRVDQKILASAVTQVARWKRTLGLDVHVHVNASQETLRDPSYSAYVEKLLHTFSVDPRLLTIEVLETCHHFWRKPTILKTLASLTSMYVGVAVDDIGPGWQNLPGLLNWIESDSRCIPLSVVKIDQTLVRAACLFDNVSNQQIIRCCEVARNCGIGVVAEGVEQSGDLLLMRQLGCNFVQGYALGKPQSLADTTKILTQFYHEDVYLGLNAVKESQRQVTASH